MTNYERANINYTAANRTSTAERTNTANAYARNAAYEKGANTQRVNATAEKETERKSLSEIWEDIRFVCHFLPIITSIAMIIAYCFNPSNFIADYILMPIAVTGWIAAIIARPFAIIKSVFGISWKVFKFFFFMPIFLVSTTAAIAAGIVTFGLLAMVAMFAPAVFTISALIKDCKE